jgi:hypothetical protein
VLELPQRMQQVALVPDERAVQEFAAAGRHPSFYDRIHPRHLDPAEHDLDIRVLDRGSRSERAPGLFTCFRDYVP